MGGFFNAQSFDRGSKGTPQKITQCGRCGLSHKCISPKMEPSGDGELRVLFIGESPGEESDRQGIHFAGESGELLKKVLRDLDVELSDCLSTYAVICRSSKENIEPYMISACRPSLLKTIKKLKPNVIIPMGRGPLESLIEHEWGDEIGPLQRWVGWTIPIASYDAWICPTYSPTQLLKRENDITLHSMFKKHIERALELEKVKPQPLHLPALEKEVQIIKSPKRAVEVLEDIAHRKGFLAFDYETTGLKPDREEQEIVSVSFCFNGEETWAMMMHKYLIDPLRKILLNPALKKIASNIKFEERWTLAKLGCGVQGWYHDTMQCAHILDNRPQISSVKFQAFVLFGISDYSSHIKHYLESPESNGLNRIRELDENDLLMYNGLDSLLEYLVTLEQIQIINNGS